MLQSITINSRWQGKQIQIEVTVTHVTAREVSYIAVDKSVAGTLPQWQFLSSFQPMPQKKKGR